MINSRSIKDLLPEAQDAYYEFEWKLQSENVKFLVTSTYRDQECQDWLYEQGRSRPGKIVTWTRNSRHTSRKAWDIVILNDKTPTWNIKVDVDKDMIPDYEEAAKIGRKMGLVVGMDFKTVDACHFEYKEKESVIVRIFNFFKNLA